MRKVMLLTGMIAVATAVSGTHVVAAIEPPALPKPADKPVTPVHEWKGSNAQEALEKKGPENGFIVEKKVWDELRETWGLPEETEKVDLEKQLVLVGTTRGGLINGKPTLTEQGDLKFNPISTRDLRPGFRYLIVVVSRDGVKTVNGKPLQEKPK